MNDTACKPANAAVISRLLKASGFDRCEKHVSHMVRGYATFTRGFKTEALMNHDRRRVRRGSYRDGSARYGWVAENTPTGVVSVEWVLGETARNFSAAECAANMQGPIEKIAATLTGAGYHVEHQTRGTADFPYLLISRRDDNGEVIA